MSANATKRLKILFLSQRFLFPMDTGGKIRTGKILEQLKQQFDITVISNVESPQDDPYVPEMSRLCQKFVPVPWVEKKRYTAAWYWDILKKSFSRYPVTMLNDYSPELEQAVLNELHTGNYDLAICDFMQSTLNFRRVQGIPTLLFQHNVESTIPLRHMKRSVNPLMKLFWWLQYKKMFYHEKKMCRRFTGIIAVSETDKLRMEEWYGVSNVHTIPTGVDTDYYMPSSNGTVQKQLVYVGAMDWLPNEDAMFYFLSEIFPRICKEEPDTQLVVVGRNPSPRFLQFARKFPNVKVTGWVEDTRPYVQESAVFIVPIRIGGGTRMKIYEAMAMGKPVVSTSVGAEGLPLEHEKLILFADDEEAFKREVVSLLRDENKREQLGKAARKYVYDHFRWEIVADEFARICRSVMG